MSYGQTFGGGSQLVGRVKVRLIRQYTIEARVQTVACTVLSASVWDLPKLEQPHQLPLADIVSALSFALGLTERAMPGHSMRSCVLGMRLARELGLAPRLKTSLYYALLLKDVGCRSNPGHLYPVFGCAGERPVKGGLEPDAWNRCQKLSTLRLQGNNPVAEVAQRVAGIVRIGLRRNRSNEKVISPGCDRCSHILRKVGLGDTAAEAVRGLNEHWDGSGSPDQRRGSLIPIESRILAVAQHLDVFASEHGIDRAIELLRERSGHWFDPELVRVAERLHRTEDLWRGALPSTPAEDTKSAALNLAPDKVKGSEATDLDLICEAFADLLDAKSPFTYRHCVGVTDAAVKIALELGLSVERTRLVNRAALLHDIGKLRVPNSILNKQGKLEANEWSVIQEHPRLTREILSRIGPFKELAMIAGAHHEKLDGTGYPDRLTGKDLPLEARIIAVADVYVALTEDRHYRPGLALDRAFEIMSREVPNRLDADCFEALMCAVSDTPGEMLFA